MLTPLAGPFKALRDRILGLGARPTDSRDDRLRKQVLAAMAALVMVIAPAYIGFYLLIDRPLAALSPAVYWSLSLLAFGHFARTGDYRLFRAQQVVSMLVLPFTLQWSLGGFDNSSAAMVWAFGSTPLNRSALSGRRSLRIRPSDDGPNAPGTFPM